MSDVSLQELIKELGREKAKIYFSIFNRNGQPNFRKILLKAYEGKCVITQFDFEQALESAHILPYAKDGNNGVWNGLLFRCDIHTLFDLHLITVHPQTNKVYISPELKGTKYEEELKTAQLKRPKDESLSPCKKALGWHYNECDWTNNKLDVVNISCACPSCHIQLLNDTQEAQ